MSPWNLRSSGWCWLLTSFASAVSAADDVGPPANPNTAKPVAPATADTVIFRGTQKVSVKSDPAKSEQHFQEQQRHRLEQRRKEEFEEANRPTSWQLQNPSGEQNRYPTDWSLSGYIAPNTYFGPQFREWSQLSAPLYEPRLPPNQTVVPPLPQTNVMIAPYSYWGSANQTWIQVSPGSASPNSLGGWDMRVGW